MYQIGEGKFSFNSIIEGNDAVNSFYNMHSPLFSGKRFVKEGKCTLVFGRKDAHVVKGRTGELIKE